MVILSESGVENFESEVGASAPVDYDDLDSSSTDVSPDDSFEL